jgi:hypothetical protein
MGWVRDTAKTHQGQEVIVQIDEHFTGQDAAMNSAGMEGVGVAFYAETCEVVELFSHCGRAS